MIRLKIICPECKIVNYYEFGNGKLIKIGDYISNEEAIFQSESYIKEHKGKCLSCKKEFKILEIVHEGRFINALINPTKKEEELLDNNVMPVLEEYLGGFELEDRKEMCLGDDPEFIPSQITSDYIMKSGDLIYVLGNIWKVIERYKVMWCTDEICARIYKVQNDKGIQRLLVLRKGYMPTLREPTWDEEIKTTNDIFCKYSVPSACEIVMELT